MATKPKSTPKAAEDTPESKSVLKPIIVGRADLARLMGITPNEVSSLLAEGLPALAAGKKGKASKYDAVEVLTWWRRRQVKEDEVARARYFQLQGDKLEQEVRLRSNQLIEASAIEKAWSDLVLACRERLLSLPGSAIQRGVVDDTGEEVLIELVDEALQELAR